MRKGPGIVSIILLLLASTCKLDSPVYPVIINSYMPMAEGNTWRYTYQVTGGAADTLTVTMTNSHATVNGRIYFSASTQSKQIPQFTSYFYSGPQIYATLVAAATPGGPVVIDMDYLNDGISIGQTWTNKLVADGVIGGVPAQMLGTMVEKETSMKINQKTYYNVIHTRADVQYDFGDGFKTYTTYNYYSSLGVGIIKLTTSAGVDTISNQEIISYDVKQPKK